MPLLVTATLGSFTFLSTDGVEPGSDTGWNLDPKIQETFNLGALYTTILELSRASHIRSFNVWLPPARFLLLKALQRTVAVFTDWSGDTRNVYVKTVKRESGSRPFLVKTLVEFVEQP